jgi:hypothetical protein
MTSGINLRRFYETRPYQCTDTELACLIEGRQAVVGDPERWFHLYFPVQAYRQGLQVLVIGCNNLEAARLAAGAPHTQFLAIDHDDTALDRLDRLKQHYRLANLELKWLGSDQIQILDRQFDLIFCPEGLPPPLAPEEFLLLARERLAVTGSLNLTVGGRHGNVGLALFRRLLETGGLDMDSVDAPTVRQWLEAVPASHPFAAAAAELPDLVRDEGLLDALRTCEPAFSTTELQDLLESGGLRLQRFLCQAHYLPECSALASFAEAGRRVLSGDERAPAETPPGETPAPGDRLAAEHGLPREAALMGGDGPASEDGPAREAAMRPALPDIEGEADGLLALTELFRGNLRTHTVIACRDDRPVESHAVRFTGSQWRRFKPIRNPGLEIDPGPFPGDGVARLSWAAHEDAAISLIVDETQARLFDAIDGSRSIEQIVEAAALRVADPERVAQTLFQALWRRDFVWFQIPAAPGDDWSGRQSEGGENAAGENAAGGESAGGENTGVGNWGNASWGNESWGSENGGGENAGGENPR